MWPLAVLETASNLPETTTQDAVGTGDFSVAQWVAKGGCPEHRENACPQSHRR